MSMLINRYPTWPNPVVDCSGDELITVQAEKNDVDINKIVSKLAKGQAVTVNNSEPFYGDVSELTGLQDAIIMIQEANELFMQYPAELREKFDNDPVKFVDFMSDEKNIPEAIKLGLAQERPKDIVSDTSGNPEDPK